MNPRFSIATLFREGGVFLFLLMLTVPLAGQSLRLSDLVTTSTVTSETPEPPREDDGRPIPPRPESLKDLSAETLPGYLDGLEVDLKYRRYDTALHTTDLLSSWLPREATEYGKTLWYRARAYKGLGEKEKLIALSQEYLTRFPKGKQRGWFLVRLAEEKEDTGKAQDAVIVWKAILKEKHDLSPEDALEGAKLLNRTGNAREARQLLPKENLSADEQMVLMESLLVVDDPEVAVPEALALSIEGAASYELRRGLLFEIRHQKQQARECYDRLMEYRRALNDQEQRILKNRRIEIKQEHWPPVTKEEKENDR